MDSRQKTATSRNTPHKPLFEQVAVTNHMLPSERFGKRIWLWLAISAPVLWIVHSILLGIGSILGEHFSVPAYLTAILYGWLCIQSTSDVYNSISTILHNRNTLLGYLYSIGLSIGNVGFWLLATDSSFAPFVMLLMIATGLMTGRLAELNMRKNVYSEHLQTYFTDSLARTFPIEYLPTVLNLVDKGAFSHLSVLPARYDENCCTVQVSYGKTSAEAIVNVETEAELEYSIAGFTFVLPMTQKRIVYSMHVNLKNCDKPNLGTKELEMVQDTA